jgi:hypothetical protein
MEIKIARLLSYILHPLLIPTLSFLVIYSLPTIFAQGLPVNALLWLLITVFLFTFLIPAAGTLLLLHNRKIRSVEMNEAGERTLPLMIAGISYMTLYYLTRNASIPAIYLYFIYGSIIILVTGMVINLFWKISLHTLAWGAATGALTGISIRFMIGIPVYIACTILLSGLAGFGRLKLNAHSQSQVYMGFAVGAGLMLLLTLLL